MGHDIVPVDYRPRRGPDETVEALTTARVLENAGAERLATTQRLGFHLVLVVTGGQEHHVVDFTGHDLQAGSVLWVRPGQVHRWGDLAGCDGVVLVFPPGALDAATDVLAEVERPPSDPVWHLVGRERAAVEALAGLLLDLDPVTTPEPVVRAQRLHLLAAVLLQLRLARTGPIHAGHELPPAFTAFRDAVEQHFREDHQVAAYARRLGYSSRTLARATRAATGQSPKQLVDARLLLEAKRMLAHSDLAVATVGRQLGFGDAANFSAFFRHRAGILPGAFRRQVTGRA